MVSPSLDCKRTRPRGQSDPTTPNPISTQQTNSRHRRTSLESRLYDSDYKEYIHDSFVAGDPAKHPWLLEPPKQIETPQEANRAYYFAHYRLKHRDVTPRTEAFLIEYRKSLKGYLEAPSDESRKVEVKTLTRILHSKTILYKDPAPDYQDAITAVKELAKLRYYADYGDYLVFLCNSFRQKCAAARVEHADLLIGKTWCQIQEVMAKEDQSVKEYRNRHGPVATQGLPQTPMTTVIFTACMFLGLDFDNVQYCIDWYADRNKNAHSNVTLFIRNCDWDGLGRQLWRDMNEIPNVFGTEDVRRMTESLGRLRDQFFLELTATSRITSDEAADLLEKKQERDRAREAARREQKRKELEAERKRAAAVRKSTRKANKQQRERASGDKKKERGSKSSGDIMEDGGEGMALDSSLGF